MRAQSLRKCYAYAMVVAIALTGLGTTTKSQDLPSYMAPISGRTVSTPADIADYYLMDYELMGGDARAAIVAESANFGTKPFLPPPVPFDSKQWPMRITPGPGPTSLPSFREALARVSHA